MYILMKSVRFSETAHGANKSIVDRRKPFSNVERALEIGPADARSYVVYD